MSLKAASLVTAALGLLGVAQLSAEPSFARKYHADCTLCHTVYPRLNRTGYEFRRHGYRFVTSGASTASIQPASDNAAPANGSKEQGEHLVGQLYCRTCHTIQGTGGHVGPVLDGVKSRRSPEYIAAQITNPKQHNPSSIMPPAQVTPAQLADIVAFLTSLPEKTPEKAPDKSPDKPGQSPGQSPSKSSPTRRAGAREGAGEEPKILDYIAATYTPAIRLSQSNGEVDAFYDTRELTLFFAGPLGPYFSAFVESTPTTDLTGFAQKWGEAQGVFTTRDPSDFAQVRAGQLLELQGAGFGGTDRIFSDSFPLVYLPVNGFAAARYLRGVSGEYTFGEGTTLKAFGGESSDHSRSEGAVLEQVVGNTGLSGFSIEFADGWNPLLRNDPTSPELRFLRVFASANRTFQDSHNRERANLIGVFMVGNDNHRVGGDPSRENRSYGSYVELDLVPIPRHLGAYFRFDQLRPSTQQDGSMRAGTVGVTVDVTHYARLLLEYQRFDFFGGSNFYSIGFRANF